MIIYKITNMINGKVYIGQTKQPLNKRWMQHKYKKSTVSMLRRAIEKYGRDAFTIEVMAIMTTQASLNAKEIELIKQFNSLVPNGYNLTSGGEGGYVRSEVTKKLLSEAGKGRSRPHTLESRAKLSVAKIGALNPQFGKKQSADTKAKRSAALKGRKLPAEVIAKIKANHNPKSNLNLTYRRTPGVKQK